MQDRIPAFPLIANDPYFSVWMPADTLTGAESIHWSGAPKPLTGALVIDGRAYGFLGKSSRPEMITRSIRVTPTATESVMEAAGVRLTVRFWSPALPDELDVLSMPVTFVDLEIKAVDGDRHSVQAQLNVSDMLCYDGQTQPPLLNGSFTRGGISMNWLGQRQQKVLSHSGDHITMDWGYLYLACPKEQSCTVENGLCWRGEVNGMRTRFTVLLGYDDVASVDYFGTLCRAWYMRNGKTLPDAMEECLARHDELQARCCQLDEKIIEMAQLVGGEDYRLICCAAWRHTFAAHKLIATPDGQMALLSKENDSNGCIGTVDVSYPSIPLFLKFCPELVNALCRPVLQFASMPVWKEDFAPHDVGRYPYATGQVYAAHDHQPNGAVYPPYYLYSADSNVYDLHMQMPVEECGNMLIMLSSAVLFGAGSAMAEKYYPLMQKWVTYLDRFGVDPGEQLCTDDFAGHLAHNVNLSAKAAVGMACYARLLARIQRPVEGERWQKRAEEIVKNWLEKAKSESGTALTFDGKGWSMKYNLIWDRILGLGLLPDEFYKAETESYLPRMNAFGLPLDSRADYTKSDWLVWSASMAQDKETFEKLIAPLAHYLRATPTRVPFSDWYDTKTGRYVAFIARSVQGGVFMKLLMK